MKKLKVEVIEKSKIDNAEIEYAPENDTAYIRIDKIRGYGGAWEIAAGLLIIVDFPIHENETLPQKIAQIDLQWVSNNIFSGNKIYLWKNKEKKGLIRALDSEADTIEKYRLKINPEKNIAYIEVSKKLPTQRISVAKNVLFDLDKDNKVVGIWLLNVGSAFKKLRSYALAYME